MERITDKYVFFWGSELSNWYDCKFTHKGIPFKNSEQAFMWEKAKFFNDEETAHKILITPNPSENKALGRKVKGFDADIWSKVSYDIMFAVNFEKFNQNHDLKYILLSTDDKIIVEASPYDKIWGIGLYWDTDDCLDEANWDGLNLLGKALMDVREILWHNKYGK